MELLTLDAFRNAPLIRKPFPYLIVPGFIADQARQILLADFPAIERTGSFPVSELQYGPGFAALLDELRGPELARAMEAKFEIDLSGRPTMITVRGRCRKSDGRIHTDSANKIITCLLYANVEWNESGGCLRLLRNGNDLEARIEEVRPLWGTLVAFRRADNSFHGHLPFEGVRRVIQLNWVREQEVADRELARHRRSAWFKRILSHG
jgi:hypothetical protein